MSFTSPWRDVYLVCWAKGISVCGDMLAATALVLVMQAAGRGGHAVSALLLAAALPLVVLAPITGRLADRVDSRRLLVTVGLAQSAVCALLAVTTHPIAVIALVALLAAGLAVTQPTLAALVPSMVRREDMPRAGALSQTAGSFGAIAGPALAGLLVGAYGVRVPLLLDAVSYLALVVAAVLIRTRRGGPAAGRTAAAPIDPTGGTGPAGPGAAAAWRFWGDPLLRTLVISMAAVVGAVGAINVVEVFFVRGTLGASVTTYGLLEATFTAGMLVGAWLLVRAARRAADSGGLVLGALLMLAALCATLPAAAVAGSVGWLFPLWVIGGVLNGGMNVFAGVVTAQRVPAAFRGQAYATLGGTVQGAGLIGFLAGGFLVEAVPLRPLVAGLGLAGIAVVGLALPLARRVVRRERASATASQSAPPAQARPVAAATVGPS